MKPILILILFVMLGDSLPAQDHSPMALKKAADLNSAKNPADTGTRIWKAGGHYNLNFNQTALSNWSAGGDNSALALSSLLDAYAFYKKNRHAWDNTLDLAYGEVATSSLGTRKSDDRIDLVSKYGYKIGKSWYLSGLFNFRSQFARGYSYPATGKKVLVSSFLAPAYILGSAGLNYQPNDQFSLFLSPATARWTLVSSDSLAAEGAFGVDSGRHALFEFGAFASLSLVHKIGLAAQYQGKLDLFSNYLKDPQDIVVYWTNILSVQVSKLLTMSLTLNLVYDNNIRTVNSDGSPGGPKVQLQELIGIGFAYTFGSKGS